MVRQYSTHQLSETDIAAIAIGDFRGEIIEVLRAAELGKHVLLLEAIRRTLGRQLDCPDGRFAGKATRLLDEVQARAPEVVAETLRSPHFGLWAARFLFRLRSGAGQEAVAGWQREFGQLAVFAAVAALRIGYPFELSVPAERGRVTLPTLGTAQVGRPADSGWAQISLNRRGARIRSPARSVPLPADVMGTGGGHPGWRPTARLEAETDGIRIRVSLDTGDPLMRLLSPAVAARRTSSVTAWQRGLQEAWQILVRQDRQAAAGLASVLTTLVPLADPGDGDVISATSGWAWGAIAMNMPGDSSLVAETLDHEFRHLVLAAVEDVVPLVDEDDRAVYYAPWRDDPRPASALLQGIYAHLGVARFWRRRRPAEPLSSWLRCEVKFIYSCRAALGAGRTLEGAGALTATGRALLSGMLGQLESWQYEPVSREATSAEAEIGLAHHLRWRLSHCRPDPATVDALTRAWLGARDSLLPLHTPPSTVVPHCASLASELPRLLNLRSLHPLRFDRLISGDGSLWSGDAALLAGNYEQALDDYSRLISRPGNQGGWVGLLLARYRLSGQVDVVAQSPETAAAVYDKVLSVTGAPPPAANLIAWLNELPPLSAGDP
jgi:HEXXH motif-containing protein